MRPIFQPTYPGYLEMDFHPPSPILRLSAYQRIHSDQFKCWESLFVIATFLLDSSFWHHPKMLITFWYIEIILECQGETLSAEIHTFQKRFFQPQKIV